MIAVSGQGFAAQVRAEQMPQEWRERFEQVATESDILIFETPALRPLAQIRAETG